jgi:hypothetical protein
VFLSRVMTAPGARDVQEILAYGAHRATGVAGIENGAGTCNGGGLRFPNDVGFGFADAWAATRLAESRSAVAGTAATFSGMAEARSGRDPTLRMLAEDGSWTEIPLTIAAGLRIDKALLEPMGAATGSDDFLGAAAGRTGGLAASTRGTDASGCAAEGAGQRRPGSPDRGG